MNNHRLIRTVIISLAAALGLGIFFQNCSKGLVAIKPSDSMSNLDSSSPTPQTPVTTPTGPDALGPDNHALPQIVMDTGQLKTTVDMTFSVYAETALPSASFEWKHQLGGVVGACTVKSDTRSTTYTITCSKPGDLNVSVTMLEGVTPVFTTPFLATIVDIGAPPPPASLVVNFSVVNGTGKNPWNTLKTTIETFIGQTLIFKNDDTINHQLHTGGAPCPHGTLFKPGASYSCIISKPLTIPATGPSTYDHLAGKTASVFLLAYDGAALYKTNCASCHGTLPAFAGAIVAGINISKAQPTLISTKIATIPAMKVPTLMALTPTQIQAISNALGGYGK